MNKKEIPKFGVIVKGNVELKDNETKETIYKGQTSHEKDELILLEVDKRKVEGKDGLTGKVKVKVKKVNE